MALHNPFAKKILITVDANKDGWMTFQGGARFRDSEFCEMGRKQQ
jgi:hypothetical protein